MPPSDHAPGSVLRSLQKIAVAAARECGARTAVRVVVYCAEGIDVVNVLIPESVADDALRAAPPAPPPTPKAGWDVGELSATYDGERVAVGRSRLKLLSALLAADGPLSAKELVRLAFPGSNEENVRGHIKTLRRELADAFPDHEGECVPNSGDGYVLAWR